MAGHERRAFTRTEAIEALGRMSQNVRRVTMRAVRVRRAGSERHAGMYGFGTVDSDHMLSKKLSHVAPLLHWLAAAEALHDLGVPVARHIGNRRDRVRCRLQVSRDFGRPGPSCSMMRPTWANTKPA